MKARKVKGLDPDGPFADNARRIVAVRLDEVTSLGSKAPYPEAVEELHDARIAAKRLRYVLELAGPALGRPAANGARVARRLQDLLGEIHDCDEMLPRVRAHAERLREEDVAALRADAGGRAKDLDPAAGARAPNLDRYRGLEALAGYLTARREILFERYVREWQALERRDFAAALLASLNSAPPGPAARSDGGAP